MATILEYLDLAFCCYAGDGARPDPNGFEVQKWEWGTWYGDGFQGGVFENRNEIIVGFSGTKGSLRTAPISQNSANARIGVNVIPNMAGSAFAMVNWARERAHGRPISICGHSLGGGLAQVVGNWASLPFISFNGPGMASHLKMAAFNFLKPRQLYRSVNSPNTSDTVGICFTVKGDFVGEFGAHVGHEIVLTAGGVAFKHGYDALFVGLTAARRNATPRQLLSVWPAPPSIARARR